MSGKILHVRKKLYIPGKKFRKILNVWKKFWKILIGLEKNSSMSGIILNVWEKILKNSKCLEKISRMYGKKSKKFLMSGEKKSSMSGKIQKNSKCLEKISSMSGKIPENSKCLEKKSEKFYDVEGKF